MSHCIYSSILEHNPVSRTGESTCFCFSPELNSAHLNKTFQLQLLSQVQDNFFWVLLVHCLHPPPPPKKKKKKKLDQAKGDHPEGVLPYMGHIGMCSCEGYGFQAVYSSIGYTNQSVWVQNRLSFFTKLAIWLKILSRVWKPGIYSSIG